jgi:hypothetical protein
MGLPELLFQNEDQLFQPLFGDEISRFHHRQASLCKASFQFLPVISFGHRFFSYFGLRANMAIFRSRCQSSTS